jgi:hypothetical protein
MFGKLLGCNICSVTLGREVKFEGTENMFEKICLS